MADNEEGRDVSEGRLPPSNPVSVAGGMDLDGMPDNELVALVEEALDRLPAHELKAIRDLAEEKRQGKLEGAKQDVLEEMREKLEALGLTISDLFPSQASRGRRMRSDSGQQLPVKYRGPNGETWSGRGRMPSWLVACEATGRMRDEFLVNPEEQ